MKSLEQIIKEFQNQEGVQKINRLERTGFKHRIIKIYYEITKEYQRKHNLLYKHRICEINTKDFEKQDYADTNIITSFEF